MTPAQATGLVVARPEKRTAGENKTLEHLGKLHPEIQTVLTLFASFAALVRERSPSGPAAKVKVDEWLVHARASQVPEIAAFALKLGQDLEAVLASLTLSYRQGQTEGQVNRLKLREAQHVWAGKARSPAAADASKGRGLAQIRRGSGTTTRTSFPAAAERHRGPAFRAGQRRLQASELLTPHAPTTISVHQLLARATKSGHPHTSRLPTGASLRAGLPVELQSASSSQSLRPRHAPFLSAVPRTGKQKITNAHVKAAKKTMNGKSHWSKRASIAAR
jgi:Transposase